MLILASLKKIITAASIIEGQGTCPLVPLLYRVNIYRVKLFCYLAYKMIFWVKLDYIIYILISMEVFF